VYDLYEAVDLPIIGMGGVVSAEDALDFFACGARVVALGSGLFRDPFVAPRMAGELGALLSARGTTLEGLIGLAHRP
jgi:dihydroorotate dehydrogenase (NAD+) catalytic subunit